jgi:hypothetical protein
MSAHKVKAGTMWLYISPENDGNYDTVVCGLNVGRDDSAQEIDASSQCGPDTEVGTLTLSRSFEGQHLQDPETGKISGTSLRTLFYNKTKVGYMIAPEDPITGDPVTGDEVETGEGYITALSDSYAFDAVGTFQLTLKPSGTPTFVTVS